MSVSETMPLTKADYEAQAAFRYALRLFLHSSEEAARSAGLTPQQYQALLAIQGYSGREEVTIGELAERLQLRPHSTVELVDRMEAQDLLLRRTMQEDRRVVYVCLTEQGRVRLGKVALVHRKQLHHLRTTLRDLLRNLEESEEG